MKSVIKAGLISLMALVFLAGSLGFAPTRPAAAAALTKAQVKKVQENLNRVLPGLDIAVDGIVGPDTKRHLCAFRRLKNLPDNPNLKPPTKADLERLLKAKTSTLRAPSNGKNYISVDKTCQMAYVAKDGKWKRVMRASTGKKGKRTPSGTFAIQWSWKGWHESSKYAGGMMYNSRYFKDGGYAVHGSKSVPGYPASSGCVRVVVRDADWLWNNIPDKLSNGKGFPIYIYGTEPS